MHLLAFRLPQVAQVLLLASLRLSYLLRFCVCFFPLVANLVLLASHQLLASPLLPTTTVGSSSLDSSSLVPSPFSACGFALSPGFIPSAAVTAPVGSTATAGFVFAASSSTSPAGFRSVSVLVFPPAIASPAGATIGLP